MADCCANGRRNDHHGLTHDEYQARERIRQRELYARRVEHERERQKAYRAKHPNASAEQARRKRARLRSNGWEPYRDRDIFERDGWRCHLCHRKVDPNLHYLDEMSASIDHLIPISAGGPDTALNVALAHRICNQRRYTTGDAQLRLIA